MVEDKEVPFQQNAFENVLTEFATLPDTSEVSHSLIELKNKINALQAQGVEIVFLEMPINAELSHSVRSQYIRQTFRAAFPPPHYHYVPYKEWNFKTTDGLHLNSTEALIFTKYLKAWYLNGEYNPDGTALTPKD